MASKSTELIMGPIVPRGCRSGACLHRSTRSSFVMILGRLVHRGAFAALLVSCCAFAPAASAAEFPLETYSAGSAPVFTSADPLAAGHVYVVGVRGTFSYWS